MNALLQLDTALFLEGCEVTYLEGEKAQEVVAEALVGEELALEQAS